MRFREWIKKINIKGIWERNAFYILLAICVLVMGAVAWTSRSQQDTTPQPPPAEEKLAVTPLPEPELMNRRTYTLQDIPGAIEEAEAEAVAEEEEVPSDTEKAAPDGEEQTDPAAGSDTALPDTAPQEAPAENPEEEPEQQAVEAAAQAQDWQWPLLGTVMTPYAAEQLIYWETLGAWRVHPAIDIKPGPDTMVFAVTGGTVSLVTEDDMLGYMIIIDHDDGIQTCYASLTEDILVEAGQLVICGQQIGAAGNTARSEQAAGTHLHFAVWQDGQSVDPLSYLSAS